jgi:plastocyanin
MRRALTTLAIAATVGGAAVPALAATKTISIKDNYFVRPGGATVTVKRGTTVTWVWRGRSAHNVSARGAARFTSPIQKRGSFSRRVVRRGTYRVVCTLHPGMRMTLKVS